jgi:selenocysteine-specific elongation factor
MHIVGTAGHVDHGKSSLVIALTGHNPDRLIEEQQRGMTLDLGFAPLRFEDGVEAGIIDVPGHERFLHNMLAGAAGMELLLLVIAANEGPKRQTFEHLQILNFLNVSRAIIVLTKIDLVQLEERALAAELVQDACKGTVASSAPIVEVSTVTGEGIERLKSAIHDALAALPSRRTNAPAFLPIDRVFALPGHGTIVTGTLMQGTVSIGDTLSLQPSGLVARVKNLQIFGNRAQNATGGSRVAVNLPGIEVEQIARGETLVAAREFVPTRELEIEFTPIPDAVKLLRKRLPVRVHIGSAEVPGQMRLADGSPSDARAAHATISLWRPVVAYPGMRLIVRRMSPKDLLGGAKVLAHGATSSQAPTEAELALQGSAGSTADVASALQGAGLCPLDAAKLAARSNVTIATASTALLWLVEHGRAIQLQKPAEFLSQDAYDRAFEKARAFLQRIHAQSPWRLGASSTEIGSALGAPEKLAVRLLAAWHEDGRIASRARSWHLPDFKPAFTKEQRDFFAKSLPVAAESAYLPHSFAELANEATQRSKTFSEALDTLVSTGALIRIGDDVYRHSQIEQAKAAIASLLQKKGQATMAEIRDVLGTSRKYALPLMEYFDSIGFTIRVGDLRRLRHAD